MRKKPSGDQITLTQAALKFGIPRTTLQEWIDRGELSVEWVEGTQGRGGKSGYVRVADVAARAETWQRQARGEKLAEQFGTDNFPFEDGQYYSLEEVRAGLGKGSATINRWIARGKLQAERSGRFNAWRVKGVWVREMLEREK